ncbi:MAG: DUF401 family protein [Spirochaetales bacterium]|nr:DUF401 family protein [Spirochaetales bacterium]
MEIIVQAPAILKIAVSLLFILVVNRLTKNLLIAVSAATVMLAFWAGHSVTGAAGIVRTRMSQPDTVALLIVIFGVIWFTTQMAETGVMKEMVGIIKNGVSQRCAMAVLPALIGLLPMPGGALFSAPLLDDCDTRKSVSPGLKARINYWFRHIWEYWWPLYPGVILAITLSGLPLWQFVLLQLPLSVLSVLAGSLFLLRNIKRPPEMNEHGEKMDFRQLFIIILPVIVVIGVYAAIRLAIPALAELNQYLPMYIGIITAMIVLQVQRPLAGKRWIRIFLSKKTFSLALLVAVIRIYGAFIEAPLPDGRLIMDIMKAELGTAGIPLIAVIVIVPFISGLSTGIAFGFVGASFPIVVNIIGTNPGTGVFLSSILLAYASGYMGMILSPVHVCFIVTNEYFKTELLRNLIKLIMPVLFVLAGAFLLFFMIRIVIP